MFLQRGSQGQSDQQSKRPRTWCHLQALASTRKEATGIPLLWPGLPPEQAVRAAAELWAALGAPGQGATSPPGCFLGLEGSS